MTADDVARPNRRRKRLPAPTVPPETAEAKPTESPPSPASETPATTEKPARLARAAAFTTDVRTLAVNLTILFAIVLIAPAVLTQFMRDQVLIDPISVPEAMQANGLTPEIAGRRLWDGLKEVKDIAGTAKATINAIPDSEQVSFSIPDSGLSIDSLIYYVRRFFNIYETHIGGEFRCADPACAPEGISLRLRIVRGDLEVRQLAPVGNTSEADYFRDAATEVMSVLDPYVAIAARSGTEPGRAKALAYRLVASGHKDARWANNLLGNLLLDEGRIDEAIAQFEAALKADPGFLLARTNLGNALRLKGDFAGARAAYTTVHRANPKDVFAVTGLARLAEAERKPDEAIALLLDAAKADPLAGNYFVEVARIENNRANTEAAVRNWNLALQIEPDNAMALAQLSYHYFLAGALTESERLYGLAADYRPTDAAAVGEHAEMLVLTEQYERALQRADQAVSLSPRTAKYRIIRARALTEIGRNDDALADFRVAQDVEPNNADIPYYRGATYDRMGRYDEAIADYRAVIARDPSSTNAIIAQSYIDIIEIKKQAAAAPPDTASAPDEHPQAG